MDIFSKVERTVKFTIGIVTMVQGGIKLFKAIKHARKQRKLTEQNSRDAQTSGLSNQVHAGGQTMPQRMRV